MLIMEKSEPTFVPEWLRSNGTGSNGGGSGHLFASSSSHSDSSSLTRGGNRNSKGLNSFDSLRSSFLDRSSSSNSRRSSSNGSAKNAYSSFNRNHRDKDRDRDKDRLSFSGDYWDHDSSVPVSNLLSCRVDNDTLRRSHSMITRRQDDYLPRKPTSDLKNPSGNNHANGNGLTHKAVSEKDFPSLVSEDRQTVTDVASPVLPISAQSLPVVSSSLVGGEGWTSALVDAPNNLSSTSASSSTAHLVSTALGGLNMAEALTQVPAKIRASPQPSVQLQIREELAIKQSRQLIPVTPSMPKMSVLTTDKSKPKTSLRSSEAISSAKITQQAPSPIHSGNHAVPSGAKADASKAPHGKLYVLKPGWENGVHSQKDPVRKTDNQSAINPKAPSGDRKPSPMNLMSNLGLEKKPSLSQTQSRNDFFNNLKKKTSNSSPAQPGSSCNFQNDAVPVPLIQKADKSDADPTGNDDVLSFSEEETAFLRSLGWEENSGEGGLTEEEINSFYKEYMNKKPELKQMQERNVVGSAQ